MATEQRDWRGWLGDSLRQDLQYALRRLFAQRTFALIPTITLALGIGATTTIFSVVNTVLIQPLPYKDSDRLVRIVEHTPPGSKRSSSIEKTAMNEERFLDWRQRTKTLSDMGLYRMAGQSTMIAGSQTARPTGLRVTPSIFTMLGVTPVIGRLFEPGDEHRDVVLISTTLWQQFFDRNPDAVGRAVTLGGRSVTIVGVLPASFAFPMPRIEFWRPYTFSEAKDRRTTYSAVVAKLAEGVTVEAATSEAIGLGRTLDDSAAAAGSALAPVEPASTFEVLRMKDELVAPALVALRVLMVSAAAVLLIVCANVANLMLARGAARQKEMSIRLALGASRGRIVRQLLVESVVLALTGGVMGIALAYTGVALVKTLSAVTTPELFQFAERMTFGGSTIMPRLDELGIDTAVLAFAVAASGLTGVLFGIAPALHLSRVGAGHARGAAAAAGSSRVTEGRSRLANLLVVGQLTLATALLVSAALLIHSFMKLSAIDPGYDPTNVLTFQLVQPMPGPAPEKLAQAEELLTRLDAHPQVRFAGFISAPPLVPVTMSFGQFVPPGRTSDEMKKDPVRPQGRSASREYLRAMGVRLIEGRWFDERDDAGGARVLLVNRTLARHYFGQTSPVGASVRLMGDTPWQIVGVVEDMRQAMLTQEPAPMMFVDPRQVIEHGPGMALGFLWYAVRTTGDPASIISDLRRLTREMTPTVALDSVATLDQLMIGSIRRQRLYAVLLGTFAGIAAVIAAVGIYGVLTFAVTQRTREIGVRIALGAQPGEVVRLVMRRGVPLTVIGIAAGLAGAMTLSRFLTGMLFGLTPSDPFTYVLVASLFTVVAVMAVYLPARRATTVDPIVALRHE